MGKSSNKPFYIQWLCVSVTHSFGISDLVAPVIGLIIYVLIHFIVPTTNVTLWIIIGTIGGIVLIRLLLAPYWIYKGIKKERDELLNVPQKNGVIVLKQPSKLIIEVQDIAFGASGNTGYPLLNSDKARWIRLGLSFAGNVFIETLEIVISGKEPILANEWKPGGIVYYHYFRIPDWVKHDEQRTIQVQAFANGVKWGSPEISINFPVL